MTIPTQTEIDTLTAALASLGLSPRRWTVPGRDRLYVTTPNLNAKAHGTNGFSASFDLTSPKLRFSVDADWSGARTREAYESKIWAAKERRDEIVEARVAA